MATSARCTFIASFALHRIFVAPKSIPRPARAIIATPQFRGYARPAPTARRLPSDDLITARSIHVVNDDGTLSPPQDTRHVLRNLDRKAYTLQTVSVPDANSAPGSPTLPVCRIISKRQILEAAKAAKANKKPQANPERVTKTIELNWAIDGNDLSHRLKRIREFLERGNKVEVALAGKRKGRKASPEEAKEVLEKVRAFVVEDEGRANGWREYKALEGAVGGVMTVYLEGKVVEQKKAEKIVQETQAGRGGEGLSQAAASG